MSVSRLSSSFSITQAKSLVKDLSKPVAAIYWIDFILTIVTGHAAFFAMLHIEKLVPPSAATVAHVGLFAVASILYMRAAMFIHELVHLPAKGFRAFRVAWNLLCGIPFLIPSFMYYPHVEHHRRKHYGTEHDGEYLDLSHRPPLHVVLFLGASLVVPFAAFLRFGILGPISWFFPQLHAWLERHASSMIIDIFYLRGDYGPAARRVMRWQELACFLWCVFLVARAPLISGTLVDNFLPHAYALSVCLILINNVRTLGAHRWMGDGRELSFEEQLLDSVNYPYRPWITELWGPVGTRYHALHHLFPGIPYHNLGVAHRRLMAGLPHDSIYRDTVRVTLVGAIAELWTRAANRPSNAASHTGDKGRSKQTPRAVA